MAYKIQQMTRKQAERAVKNVTSVQLTSSKDGTLILGNGLLVGRPAATLDYAAVYPDDETGKIALQFGSEKGAGISKLQRAKATTKLSVHAAVAALGFVLRPDNLINGTATWETITGLDEAGNEQTFEALVCEFPAETNGIPLKPAPDAVLPPVVPRAPRRKKTAADTPAE